jgi:hypothetical protein
MPLNTFLGQTTKAVNLRTYGKPDGISISKSLGLSVTPKEFKKYLKRDGHCYHCGIDDETLIPQHRINRGMGGSKLLNTPSNIIVLCSYANGLIESNAFWADRARQFGWKLPSWAIASENAVFDVVSQTWFLLDDSFNRVERQVK